MEQLVYVSTASASVAGDDLFNIIETAARRNPQRGITGFLVFVNGAFLQYVEGPSGALDQLLDDLHGDGRHHSITVLARRACGQRAFPSWRMKRLAVTPQGGVSPDLAIELRRLGLAGEALRTVERLLSC